MSDDSDSDPPEGEETSYHAFLTRGEYRADRREAREWRRQTNTRLEALERKVTVGMLLLGALSAAERIPWADILKVFAGGVGGP